MAPKSPATKKQKSDEGEAVEVEAAGPASGAKERASGKASPAKAGAKRAASPEKEAKASGPAAAAGKRTAGKLAQPTIVDVLLADHRETLALMKAFQAECAKGEPDAQRLEELVDAIALTVRLHSQAEMEVLYPLLLKEGGEEGKTAVDYSTGDHQKIEADLLVAIEKRKTGASEELSSTMEEVTKLFEKHLKEEEDSYVPLFLEKMGMDQGRLADVAVQFMAAKEKAPLEPQPEAEPAAA